MRKKTAAFLTIAMTAALLTGCGSSNKNIDTDIEIPTKDTSVLESGDINLKVWSGAEDEELIKKIADSFIAENKDKANIKIQWECVAEGDCRSTLLGDILNGPDVYTTTDGEISTLASGGGAATVTNPDKVKKDTLDSAVKAVTVDDKIYGYPITADNGYFLYYNKKYLSEEDVKSLDKILKVAEAKERVFAMDWTSGWYMYSFFGMSGLSVGINEDGLTNHCDWNSTEGKITGAEIVKSMTDIANSKGFASMSQEQWLEGAKSGEVIALVSGVWDADAIKAAWGNDMGATVLPTYTCNGTAVQMASFFGYKFVGVNPHSEHIAWAQKLAEYIANADNQKLRFEMRSQGPANTEAANSDEVKNSVAIKAVIAQSEFSTLQRIGGNYWGAMTNLGEIILNGNEQKLTNQEIIDLTVEKITASTVQ